MTDTPPEAPPSEGYDVQGSKRELLTLGRERGYVTEQEVIEAMPAGMVTPTELEVFFFTLDMMEIELRLDNPAEGFEPGRLTLLRRLTDGLQDDGTLDGGGME